MVNMWKLYTDVINPSYIFFRNTDLILSVKNYLNTRRETSYGQK